MSQALDTLSLFAGAYAATLAMGVVCAYLGLFTVLRRIVFTGVALAQLAAAGVAASFFVADHPAVPAGVADLASRFGATAGSLLAALLGTLALEARPGQRKVSADAVVGLAYCGASALAILLVWRSSRGLEELRNILAGEVLLSRRGELVVLGLGLLLVAAVHARYRREFLLVSYDPELARALGLPERRYQLLLLGSLAVAVALSLRAGGLLLVFSFLVLPPVAGLLLGRGLTEATAVALAAALAASVAGFGVAISQDLPVAPSISACLVAVAGVAAAAGGRPLAARLARGALSAGAVLALVLVPVAFVRAHARAGGGRVAPAPPAVAPPPSAPPPRPHVHAPPGPDAPPDEPPPFEAAVAALEGAPAAAARREAALRLAALADPRGTDALVTALGDTDPLVRDAAADALRDLVRRPGVRERIDALAAAADDAERRALGAVALLSLGDRRGVDALVAVLGDARAPLFLKETVLSRLLPLTGGEAFGYDPFADDAANAGPLAAWRAWLERTRDRIVWDAAARAFRVAPAAPPPPGP